jgi:hypothetical protein
MYQAFDSLLAFQGQLLLVILSFGMVFPLAKMATARTTSDTFSCRK